MKQARHSLPYGLSFDTILAMLGLACVILPVTAPIVYTVPCIRSLRSRFSNHASTVFHLVSSIFHSASFLAGSGALSNTVLRFSSHILGEPFGVNITGFQPNSSKRSMICFGLPRLKGLNCIRENGPPTSSTSMPDSPTLDISPFFVYRGITSRINFALGRKCLCTSSLIVSALPLVSANKATALRLSTKKP